MGPSPARKLIPTRTEFLQPGMYVAELDRAWAQSPFPGPGLLITNADQVEQLRRCSRYVYVDPERGATEPREHGLPSGTPRPLALARRVLADGLQAIGELVHAARLHRSLNLDTAAARAADIADQVIHNADALHWALRAEDHGSLLFRRAVGTAAVATALGHQLGLDRETLRLVALGGLLLDLGKVTVPVPILAKPFALDSAEQTYVRRHVERGIELLAGRGLDARALEMLAGHHERLDGSGYPHGLVGTRIPLFARIAAVADAFDAMTLNRRYAAAVSPHAALRQLESQPGEKLDAALVAELGRALGTYPTGTLVELVDGGLGLVCAQRHGHPLQPHVIVTHDPARQPVAVTRVTVARGAADIVRSLPPHVARIDASQLEAALGDLYQAA